jgi:hypothetical protein
VIDAPTPTAVPPALPPFHVVGYGRKGWNARRHAPTQPIAADEAEARHRAGELYGVVLTSGADGPSLPIVDVLVGSRGITAALHEHDPGKADLTLVWRREDDGPYRLQQVDRRNGNGAHTPREQLVYEYLKLDADPAARCRITDAAGLEVLEERELDLAPFDLPPPSFGDWAAFCDRALPARLWPGLPDLAWVGPDVAVAPR